MESTKQLNRGLETLESARKAWRTDPIGNDEYRWMASLTRKQWLGLRTLLRKTFGFTRLKSRTLADSYLISFIDRNHGLTWPALLAMWNKKCQPQYGRPSSLQNAYRRAKARDDRNGNNRARKTGE